jgi:hypothetical protein
MIVQDKDVYEEYNAITFEQFFDEETLYSFAFDLKTDLLAFDPSSS